MKSLYRMASLPGKWLFIALMAFTMQVHAAVNQDSAALVTLKVSNAPIEDVFLRIEAQTGFSFTYSTQLIDKKEKVSVDFKREQLGDVLRELLGKRNLRWVIRGAGIVILQDSKPATQIERFSATDSIPGMTILKGTVTAEDGYPLPGATIAIKGTNRGTTTDNYGRFVLSNLPPTTSVVGISYTGYESQEFNTKGSETVVVKMKRSVGALDEQVVIAYGTSTRRLLTGSVGKIKGEDISKQPVTNVLAAIQARVPGLVVTQQTGVPGGGFRVTIRGTNSLRNNSSDYNSGNNGSDPLYIIDGIPYFNRPQSMQAISSSTGIYPSGTGTNPLNNINPADIESIEILKDADATSIYGSRGANGVIMITTKKGKVGTMKVDANFYTGIGEVTRRMKLLNTPQYLEMRTEAYKNDGTVVYPSNAYDINGTWSKDRYTNWQDELIGGTAHSTDAQLSLTGGTTYTQYRISAGYHKETTVFPGDFSFQRASTSLNLNNTSTNKKFKSSVTVSYSYGVSDLLSQDLTNKALKISPNAPALYDNNGNLNFENSTWTNPLMYTRQPYDAKTYALIANSNLSYEFFRGFAAVLNLGYTNTTMKQILKIPISSLDPNFSAAQKINFATFQNGTIGSWNIEPQLKYTKLFSSKHQIDLLLGTTFQRETNEFINQAASGFTSEYLMDNPSAVPSENIRTMYNNSIYSYNALFARINYNYDRRYIINLSGRRDGSSRFGPGRQFANFGAIGAAWVFSDETFFRRISDVISFGKLRLSYGTTGSDQIPNYGFQDTYTTIGAGQYQNSAGLKPTQLANPDFSWEETRKAEVALDLGFWNDGLRFSASYYSNRSSNQLVGYPLPSSTGFTTVQYNLPAVVENKGWELEVYSNNLSNKSIRWTSSFNISFPRNKLIEYENLKGSSYATQYVIGEPLAIRRTYRSLGVNPTTGAHEVEDVDKNGVYDINDRVVNRFLGQSFNGGLSNSFVLFGKVNIDILLQFVKQNAINYIVDFGTMPGTPSNFPVEVMNRWRQPEGHTTIQKFSASKQLIDYSRFQLSDETISDASYVRVKNVSISYNIPTSVLQKIKFNQARVYLSGQNIFTVTSYKGLDPETQSTTLPPLRLITAGVQFSL